MLYDHEFWADLAPWHKYYSDVIVVVDHVLTEPLCPSATVKFELDRCPLKTIASSSGDTIEDAIQSAVTRAVERLSVWKHLTVNEILDIRQEDLDKRVLDMLKLTKVYNDSTDYQF